MVCINCNLVIGVFQSINMTKLDMHDLEELQRYRKTHTKDVFSRFLFEFGGGCISISPVAAESELLVWRPTVGVLSEDFFIVSSSGSVLLVLFGGFEKSSKKFY